jgi:hypothetical protein
MELDFSQEWHIVGPRGQGAGPEQLAAGPAGFAYQELVSHLASIGGRSLVPDAEGSAERLIILDAGRGWPSGP